MFEKGHKKVGGKKAGTPNKTTSDVRSVIASFADEYAERFAGWIDRVAEDNPEKAADLYLKAIEYHIPKLARTELSGDKENPVKLEFGWKQS